MLQLAILFQVMRMIQTKLSTPTSSNDRLNVVEKKELQEEQQEKQAVVVEEKPARVTHYRPPSINLSTWSERPKTQISVKEDTDYKMKNGTSKVVVNADNRKTVEILNNKNNVSIKVNGSEPIVSQGAGNVIIKIGANASDYRKPFANLNGTEPKYRPHSVAVDSSNEVSRLPIVRSVELKKPFKDTQMNRSVTQICPEETNFYKTNFELPYLNSLRNNEPVNGLRQSGSDTNFYVGADTRPVLRNAAPVVRGFNTTNAFRKSWNVNGVLPSEKETTTTNKNAPFAQVCLRKTDTSKNNSPFGNVVLKNSHNTYRNSVGAFPAAPPMPKVARQIERTAPDPRDELLSAIRSFGGKKGLKSVKA